MNVPLILNFARQDLVDRYYGSLLGGLWSFVMPLVNILIFTLVFSRIMGARLEFLGAEFSEYGYSIYLIAGILAWNAFSGTVNRMTNVFQDKAGLIGKVNISLRALPLYILVTETVIFLISMAFFVGFLLLIDFPLTWHWLLVPGVYLVQQTLAWALGFLFATLAVFLKDIREFVSVLLQLWFWFTPIVYTADILSPETASLFAFNPMYQIVTAYRDLILLHRLPDLAMLASLLISGGLLLGLALWFFGKLERDIRDFI